MPVEYKLDPFIPKTKHEVIFDNLLPQIFEAKKKGKALIVKITKQEYDDIVSEPLVEAHTGQPTSLSTNILVRWTTKSNDTNHSYDKTKEVRIQRDNAIFLKGPCGLQVVLVAED